MAEKFPTPTSLVLAACLLTTPAAIAGATEPRPAGFSVETLAPGVHALVRIKPPGFFLDSNVLFVVSDEDVVVVAAMTGRGRASWL